MTTSTLADRLAEQGYVVLSDIVSMTTVEGLRVDADTVLDQLLAKMELAEATDPRMTWWRLATGHMYVLKVKPVLDLAPVAASVATSDVLRSPIAELLGGRPRLMEDKFMYKQEVGVLAPWATRPVLGEEVCKHTDAAYFAARGFSRVLTVAVCLDDCTEAAGALHVWPGTHRKSIEHIPTVNQGPVVPDHVAPDQAAVLVEACAGSVIVWDSALVHASGPNSTGRPRRLLVLGYTRSTEQ
jgi:ectoine hydroxylase-related dioxygenase (phytanoyl-CoA dioxygenase family)